MTVHQDRQSSQPRGKRKESNTHAIPHKKDSGDRRCRRGYGARARRKLSHIGSRDKCSDWLRVAVNDTEFAVNDTEFAAIPVYRSAPRVWWHREPSVSQHEWQLRLGHLRLGHLRLVGQLTNRASGRRSSVCP